MLSLSEFTYLKVEYWKNNLVLSSLKLHHSELLHHSTVGGENGQVHANRSSYLIGSLLHPGHHDMQHRPAALARVWTLGMQSAN